VELSRREKTDMVRFSGERACRQTARFSPAARS
jgi:hypothetical protein